ncbi:MAG: thioredoxin-dependent thiol peroxidase [Bacteroidia bacterium]|nr:thioredoxin-dependent thiol peroxidase [Bacteroidia bacterium]
MSLSLLQPGFKAPDFQAKTQTGQDLKLSQFLGQKIALYFYPKDDTPGCTKQACNLRDNYTALLKNNIQVIGVSIDSADSHQKFITKYNLPFPLITDSDQAIVQLYHVWGEKNNYGKKYMGTHRVTYLIDEQGIIQHVFPKVQTENHAEQILQAALAPKP